MSTPTPAVAIKLRAFLTSKPTECVAGATLESERGVILVGRDTTGQLSGTFRAQWLGACATDFFKANQPDLVPGRCVDLELHHIKPKGDELRAHVIACQLAPKAPSWVAHEEKLRQPAQESPAA